MKPVPEEVRAFREEYRRNRLPWFYSGEIHLVFTAAVLFGAIGWHLRMLQAWGWRESLVLAATLLFGNSVEYLLHRYPLHHPYPLLRPGFVIHTLEHHRFYVYGAMEFESFKDFMMVLFLLGLRADRHLHQAGGYPARRWRLLRHVFAAMGTGELHSTRSCTAWRTAPMTAGGLSAAGVGIRCHTGCTMIRRDEPVQLQHHLPVLRPVKHDGAPGRCRDGASMTARKGDLR